MTDRQRTIWQRVVSLVLAGAFVSTTTACAGAVYAINATSASSKLETARTLGAEKLAPYEYYYAQAHLDKASEEAAAAEYGDAIDFASTAIEYAEKAIELSNEAHRGAGR